jgi:hypothetical protein
MQGLGNFRDFLRESKKDCNSTTSIADINAQYSYEDKIGGGGSIEWDLLSCGQDGSTNGYNELQRFYDEYITSEFKGLASNQVAIKALCECCKKLPHERRTHEAFKKYVNKKLGVDIK